MLPLLQALFHPNNESYLEIMEKEAADSTIKSFFCQDISNVMPKFPKGDGRKNLNIYFLFKIIQKGLLERPNGLKNGAVNPLWLCYE